MLEQLHMDMQLWGLCRLTVVEPDATFSLSIFPSECGYLLDVSCCKYSVAIKEHQVSNLTEAFALLNKHLTDIKNGKRYMKNEQKVGNFSSEHGWSSSLKEDGSGMFHPPFELEDECSWLGVGYGVFERNGSFGFYIPVLDESAMCNSKADAHAQARQRIERLLTG